MKSALNRVEGRDKMRLICPNCGAQYEISSDVIPAGGRDVQCSNCGHAWFEMPGASEAAENALDDAAVEQELPLEDPSQVDNDDDLAPAPQPPTNRPALDASVAEILREEAEREAAARRSNLADPIESQEDLGLETPPSLSPQEQRNVEAARRMARLTGEEEPAVVETTANAAAATAAATRKELLPDIEEINSSLRSSADRGDQIDPTPEDIAATKKRGFRFGFWLVFLFIGAMWLIYLLADQIKSIVPAMAGTMDQYVETVDNGRLWLDRTVQGFTDQMDTVPEDTTPEPDTSESN